MLIDNGRKSSIAGADTGGGCVGCGTIVGCGTTVGAGVGLCVGIGVGTCVGAVVGDGAAIVGVVVTVFVCPATVDPQEASAKKSVVRQSAITMLLFCDIL